MIKIEFEYYEIWCSNRKYQILIPKQDITKLIVLRLFCTSGGFWSDVTFYGNKSGLEAIRNACAVLSGQDNVVVYFPSKKNKVPKFFSACVEETPEAYEYLDLVFMKPNSLKISDWKEIRKRMTKRKAEKRNYYIETDFINMHTEEKYIYRRKELKETFYFDTVFYNIPYYKYPELVKHLEEFLRSNAEWHFFYCEGGKEVEMDFWGDDIWEN